MEERQDKILVVTSDEDEQYVIGEGALIPYGYDVQVTDDGNQVLPMVDDFQPDLIILDLHPYGLSGRDVLVALTSQSYNIPVMVIANQGEEQEALKAFRVGARDYILRPLREAELIQAVDRLFRDIHIKNERATLMAQIQEAGEASQQRLRELKTLMSIGKYVTSLGKPAQVFDRVVRAAIHLTQAESVGLYIVDDNSNIILQAGQNLSQELTERIGRPIRDDLASLVMGSQETYVGSGEGLQKFNPAQANAYAVIYAPLVVHEQGIGLLWVANSNAGFQVHMPDIMTALADYAAIAVFNTRLFVTMQRRSRQLEQALENAGETGAGDSSGTGARELAFSIRNPLTTILANLGMFKSGEMGEIPPGNRAAVDVIHRQMKELVELIDTIVPPDTGGL